MKKLLILLIGVFIFAKEFVITKYLDEKPVIGVEIEAPGKVAKLINNDFNVLDHFILDKGSNFKVKFEYQGNSLKVTYIRDESPILIKNYKSNSPSFYPFLVHRAIYDLNNYFSLQPAGFLIRKVVYAMLTAPRQSSIYLGDYTLTYKKRIITGGLNIFPKWADKNQRTIYFTKLNTLPELYKFDIYTGKLTKIMQSPGMLVVSDVKGDNLLLTMAKNGEPDIYIYNLKSHSLKQITTYPGIDVSGKFLGDDAIAFVSDRFGTPCVFEKNLTTGNVIRLLAHGKNQIGLDVYKNKLVISSRETNNAFGPNTFNLFLIDIDSEGLRRLTMKGQNNFPNFSVNGTSVMFIKKENFASKIGIIRLNEDKIFYYPLTKKLQSFDW